jgi:hypothetical protein
MDVQNVQEKGDYIPEFEAFFVGIHDIHKI